MAAFSGRSERHELSNLVRDRIIRDGDDARIKNACRAVVYLLQQIEKHCNADRCDLVDCISQWVPTYDRRSWRGSAEYSGDDYEKESVRSPLHERLAAAVKTTPDRGKGKRRTGAATTECDVADEYELMCNALGAMMLLGSNTPRRDFKIMTRAFSDGTFGKLMRSVRPPHVPFRSDAASPNDVVNAINWIRHADGACATRKPPAGGGDGAHKKKKSRVH